jgi:ABC-type Mn2+/Zn2+ transport system permease subunit
VAVACAALSPLVVARRWAFIGEGVSHSGYGGAGVIWLLSLLLPGAAFLREPAGVMLGVAALSIATALVIGRLTRDRRLGFLGFDAAVGIVLTASLAFGFLARAIYEAQTSALPAEAHSLLFGDVRTVDAPRALMTLLVAGAVVAGLWLTARQTLSYAFDPELAAVSGVPAGAVHYGLLAAIAAVIVVAAPLVGVVLVTALLVIPGAIGALLGATLGRLYVLSFAAALLAVLGALGLSRASHALPLGPLIVLALVIEFGVAATASRLRR